MKHALLISMLSLFVTIANGQQAQSSLLNDQYNVIANSRYPDGKIVISNGDAQPQASQGARTTSFVSRWYDYTDSFFNLAYTTASCHPVNNTSSFLMPMWNDTTALFGNPDGTYTNNKMISAGLVIVPFDNFWNTTLNFLGELRIRPTDSYTIDSIMVAGIYGRSYSSPAKRSVIDTFTIGVVNGTGYSTTDINNYFFIHMTNYCHDTLRYLQMLQDTINNHAANSGASTSFSEQTFTFTLSETDTFSGTKTFGLVPGYSVPAGYAIGASITFKSGDNSYPGIGTVPRDTIQYATTGNFKYGSFQPRVYYSSTGGLSPSPKFMLDIFPSDHSVGFFKDISLGFLGWSGLYIPNWAWTGATATTPSKFQYPSIRYHLKCNGCPLVAPLPEKTYSIMQNQTINIYPNPADEGVNIEFTMGTATDVRIVLKNMIGQVVVRKDIRNVVTGKARIDTRELPNGVYFYEFYAGEGFETGKVVVEH